MSETNKPDNKDNNNYIIIPANNSIKALSDKLKSSSLLSSSALKEFKKSINIKPTNLGINDGFRIQFLNLQNNNFHYHLYILISLFLSP